MMTCTNGSAARSPAASARSLALQLTDNERRCANSAHPDRTAAVAPGLEERLGRLQAVAVALAPGRLFDGLMYGRHYLIDERHPPAYVALQRADRRRA